VLLGGAVGGEGFGAESDGGGDTSDAGVAAGGTSRDGMTPVNQSAAAAAAMTAAPTSALARCDVKRRPDEAEAGALDSAVASAATPGVPASAAPAAGRAAAPTS